MKLSILASFILLTMINITDFESDKNRSVYGYGFRGNDLINAQTYENTSSKFCLILKESGNLTLLEESNSEYNKYSGRWEKIDDSLFCEISKQNYNMGSDSKASDVIEKRVFRIEEKRLVSFRDNLVINLLSGKNLK